MNKLIFMAGIILAALCFTNCSKDKDKEIETSISIPEVPAIVETLLGKSVSEKASILESNGFREMPISEENVYIWSDVKNFQSMPESDLESKAYYAPIYGTANISIVIEVNEDSNPDGYYMSAYAYVKNDQNFCITQSNSAYNSVKTNQWAVGVNDELKYADHNGIAFSNKIIDPMFIYENTEEMDHSKYVSNYIGEGFEFVCNYVELTQANVKNWSDELRDFYWGQNFYQISIMREDGITMWSYMRQEYLTYSN